MARSLVVVLVFTFSAPALAQVTIRAYGPGGPAPAMKEAAAAFGKANGVLVEVTAGPTDTWISKAREDADVIYSGSEYMMTDFVKAMEGRLEEGTIVAGLDRPA